MDRTKRNTISISFTKRTEAWTPVALLNYENEIQDWIEKVTNQKFVTTHHLNSELEDGVLLCQLMLILEERSIPKYHKRLLLSSRPDNNGPQAKLTHQHIQENVFFFIEACADYGVPKHKLFHEADLISPKPQLRNFVRVLECLETLCKVAVAKGFPLDIEPTPNGKDKTEKDFPPEAVTRAKELLSRVDIMRRGIINAVVTDFKVDNDANNASVARKKLELQIKQKGKNVDKVEKALCVVQALVRGNAERKKFQKKKRYQAFRDKVAKEILTTEDTYVTLLKELDTVYRRPMQEWVAKKKSKNITIEHVKAIFSEVEIILMCNSKLLEAIRPRVLNWSPTQCLGDIFLEIVGFLKVYTVYVQHYDNALEALSECKRVSKSFVQFLEDRRTSSENSAGHNLESFLILPIQRIPRYNLLLTELIKYTWEDHRDFANLVTAQSKMKEVADYLNEKKRHYENLTKVLQIQNSFEGKAQNLVEPTRKFVRSDVVATWTATIDSEKKANELTLTLFNDMIVVSTATSKRGTLRFQESFKLEDVAFKEAKLRKWAMKVNENGKLWPTAVDKTPTGSPSPMSSPAIGSPASGSPRTSVQDARGSRNSVSETSSPYGSMQRRTATFSARNTVELVNGKGATVLKVCFDSFLAYASWTADFKAQKDEIERVSKIQEEKALERAKAKIENAKSEISMQMSKTIDERRAEYRISRERSKTMERASLPLSEDKK